MEFKVISHSLSGDKRIQIQMQHATADQEVQGNVSLVVAMDSPLVTGLKVGSVVTLNLT